MPDLQDDLAALLHPLPRPLPADATDTEREAGTWQREKVLTERSSTAQRLREKIFEGYDEDPLLRVLSDQTRIKETAEQTIRHLVAYAREFVGPRPYTLETLAADMRTSPSAVRGAYDHRDVEAVADATGRRSTVAQTPADDAELARLVGELETRTAEPARTHVAGVAAALREQGWTPYPPVSRTPNPKFARRYLRWERRWPHGTVISLYQEPAGSLGVYAKMAADDPRWFSETYGSTIGGKQVTAEDIASALADFTDRVTLYAAEQQTNQR